MNEKPRDDSATAILRRTAPAWYWLRQNFSLASVLTLAGVIVTAGAYIINLKTRVVVIEHEVQTIKEIAPDASAVSVLKARVDDHEERIDRLEDNWDTARSAAALPPTVAPRRARRTGAEPSRQH